MSKPVHTHDCDMCIFLGSFHIVCGFETTRYDAYLDAHTPLDTAIVRFGSDGPDYLSAPVSIARENVLARDHWQGWKNLFSAHVERERSR